MLNGIYTVMSNINIVSNEINTFLSKKIVLSDRHFIGGKNKEDCYID